MTTFSFPLILSQTNMKNAIKMCNILSNLCLQTIGEKAEVMELLQRYKQGAILNGIVTSLKLWKS